MATPYIKNYYFGAKPIKVACFANSDFPAENPRTQNRNFPYTNR